MTESTRADAKSFHSVRNEAKSCPSQTLSIVCAVMYTATVVAEGILFPRPPDSPEELLSNVSDTPY